MNKYVRWALIFVIVVVVAICVIYGGYKLYQYVMNLVVSRVKEGVAEGVSKGVGKAINPLKW